MRRTSMPRGSSFPFHPTTIDPFSLLFDTACTNTLGRLNLVPVLMDKSLIALSVLDTGAPYFSLFWLLFLIGFLVLLVRDVGTLGVVARPCFLTPRTLDLTMPRVPCLVRASCFHLSTPLFLGQIILLSPTSTFISHTF